MDHSDTTKAISEAAFGAPAHLPNGIPAAIRDGRHRCREAHHGDTVTEP